MLRRCALVLLCLTLAGAVAPMTVAATPPLGFDDQPVVINPPGGTTFPVLDCGRIEMIGPGIIADPTVAAAEMCFGQAFQQCDTAAPALLTVYQRFFETHADRFFRLTSVGGACTVTQEVQAFGLMANAPRISTYACANLIQDSDGLHFIACDGDGDFTVPAPQQPSPEFAEHAFNLSHFPGNFRQFRVFAHPRASSYVL